MATQKERMCTARTGWIATLVIGLFKILVSGVVIKDVITFESFDYAGFALILTAVGGIYWGRQYTKSKE